MLIHDGRIPLDSKVKDCSFVVLFSVFFVIFKFICEIFRFSYYLK